MPIFHCTHCAHPIEAAETLAGANIKCPSCLATTQVPATVMYQPYQPPASAHVPSQSLSYGGQHSSPGDKWRIKAPLLGTLAAFILCLLKKLSEPASSLDVAMGNTDLASRLGGAVGYSLAAGIFALLIALVIAGFAAAFKKSFLTVLTRSYAISAVLASLLMLAGSAMQPRHVSAAASSSDEGKHARDELNKLQEDIQKIQAGETPADNGSPSQTAAPLADDASEIDKMMQITRQYLADITAQQKSYVAELEKRGFMKLLDPNRVMADTDLVESYSILDHARVLVKEQGRKMRELLSSLPARVRASNLSPKSREYNARQAEEGTPEALAMFNETWALEEEIVNQIAAVIDLLKTSHGHWQVSNGQFLFDEVADRKTFNLATFKINQAVARQNEIKQRGTKNTEKVFDDLRSDLPK